MVVIDQEAYIATIQLAIIDHNFHVGRERHISTSNEPQYRRVHRKSSKKWDAVPVLEKKSYSYLLPLCVSVVESYQKFEGRLIDPITKPADHPEKISSTIACTAPPPTSSIAKNKRSRF